MLVQTCAIAVLPYFHFMVITEKLVNSQYMTCLKYDMENRRFTMWQRAITLDFIPI